MEFLKVVSCISEYFTYLMQGGKQVASYWYIYICIYMYIYRERVYQAVFKRLLWSDCKFLSLFHHLCNIDDLRSLALEVFFFFFWRQICFFIELWWKLKDFININHIKQYLRHSSQPMLALNSTDEDSSTTVTLKQNNSTHITLKLWAWFNYCDAFKTLICNLVLVLLL